MVKEAHLLSHPIRHPIVRARGGGRDWPAIHRGGWGVAASLPPLRHGDPTSTARNCYGTITVNSFEYTSMDCAVISSRTVTRKRYAPPEVQMFGLMSKCLSTEPLC